MKKITKKEIQKVLRTNDRTQIFRIAKLSGVDVKNKNNVFNFIRKYAPTQKISRKAWLLAFPHKIQYESYYERPVVSYSIRFAKQQDLNSNYCKVLVKGNKNWYWCSPVYGHSDYNKSIAFPINEKNNRLAFLLNNLIEKKVNPDLF